MQVKKHKMMELVARKLSGINGVPNAERDRMVQRCAKAAAAEYDLQQRRIAELEALVDEVTETHNAQAIAAEEWAATNAQNIVLKQQNRRLMEALECMVEMIEMNGFGKDYAIDLAKAALDAAEREVKR